ncbi:ATP-dependent sacrificial sulfur transferase LarE [Balneolaceae bacterium ANBcel3]|nr:ATP-dependent sacrificial sulfur transferase LarE [Balneolaceae bacterium ANBcel3]
MHDAEKKYEQLKHNLKQSGRIAVAYSGGVDSTFLLYAAKEADVRGLIALTVQQPYIQAEEIEDAAAFTKKWDIPHIVLAPPTDPQVMENPPDRCYLCKTGTFTLFKEEVEKRGFNILADGTNADDTGEYRPGMQAIKELGVRSPLLEAGLKKEEIRYLLKKAGIPGWRKPSNTCLLTRIPYNTPVSIKMLQSIEKAEQFLIKLGFEEVRVRKHGDTARIELSQNDIEKAAKSDLRNQLIPFFKDLGFSYITIDLEGYITGSLDKNIKKQD